MCCSDNVSTGNQSSSAQEVDFVTCRILEKFLFKSLFSQLVPLSHYSTSSFRFTVSKKKILSKIEYSDGLPSIQVLQSRAKREFATARLRQFVRRVGPS